MADRAASLSRASMAWEQHDVLVLDRAQMVQRPRQRQAACEIDRELDRRPHRLQHGLECFVARARASAREMEVDVRLHADDAVGRRRLHPLQGFADRFERVRRVILRREKGRLALNSGPKFKALPDRGETVDRQEARDRRRT